MQSKLKTKYSNIYHQPRYIFFNEVYWSFSMITGNTVSVLTLGIVHVVTFLTLFLMGRSSGCDESMSTLFDKIACCLSSIKLSSQIPLTYDSIPHSCKISTKQYKKSGFENIYVVLVFKSRQSSLQIISSQFSLDHFRKNWKCLQDPWIIHEVQ